MTVERCSFIFCRKVLGDNYFECKNCKGKYCSNCINSTSGKCACSRIDV